MMRVVGIYLAAGSGTRMGGGVHKLALPIGERTLGSLALQAALQSRLDHVVVITRAEDEAEWIDPVLRAEPFCEKWTLVACADAARGQAHSLRCGVQAVQERGAAAGIVMLADQPFISSEMIDKLIDIFAQDRPFYVASGHQGLIQPPLLFAAELFPELLRLQGDEGARKILRREQGFPGQTVEFADARAFFDVDTPGAYQLACKLYEK